MSFEYEEPIRIHPLPSSDKRPSDYFFSNGRQYRHPVDRYPRNEYDKGFSERDKLLDDAITRGDNLDCDCDLWRIYDDAVMNYGLEPINPYEWLFKHANLFKTSVVISIPYTRILLVNFSISIKYYDFIHGDFKHYARYARRL